MQGRLKAACPTKAWGVLRARLTDVLAELPHEGNAELADLVVGLALGVEVAATLATAHVEAGEGILEDLLETQELKNGQVDSGVEAETALVWAKGRVELDAVALVDVADALVVFPDNAELDDALGDRDDLESLLVLGVLLEDGRALEGGGELCMVLNGFNSMGTAVARTLVGLLKFRLRHGVCVCGDVLGCGWVSEESWRARCDRNGGQRKEGLYI